VSDKAGVGNDVDESSLACGVGTAVGSVADTAGAKELSAWVVGAVVLARGGLVGNKPPYGARVRIGGHDGRRVLVTPTPFPFPFESLSCHHQ
jgi:hypothetical protein